MNQSWSIVILSYNEGKTITDVIENINLFFSENNVDEFEILVIDDGSTDDTENIVLNLSKQNEKIKYIRHPKNKGIGATLISGYKNAVMENVMAVPGDGQFDIKELKPHINFPENHFISFYRNDIKIYSAFRKLITGINKSFNKYLLNLEIKDINWVKAYKTKDYREADIKLDSSLVATEICAKLYLKGFKPIDVLSVYHERVAGVARGASLKTISQAVKDLTKLLIEINRFKNTIN